MGILAMYVTASREMSLSWVDETSRALIKSFLTPRPNDAALIMDEKILAGPAVREPR
jgi:hypothetical protein